MRRISHYSTYTFLVLALMLSCSSGGDGDGISVTPTPTPTPTPPPVTVPAPSSATLSLPENNKVCETGTNASATQSTILFQWMPAANATAYDLRITNSNTQGVTLINNIEGMQREVTLEKGMPYTWQVTSKATGTNETAQSSTWKFYLAGDGVENYAPFPTELISPASGATVSVSEDGKISLNWSGEDPDGDALTYTVYMDQTDGLQEPIATNVSETSLEVDADKDSVYYWRVKSSDGENSAFSQIYAFRTGA